MTPSKELSDQVIRLLSNLLKQVDHHVARAVADIDQTTVVDEAINKLDRNFNDIYVAVQDPVASSADPGRHQDAMLCVNNAIVALQFHDLTTQLLQRSLMRLQGMRNILSTIEDIKNAASTQQQDAEWLMHLREADHTLLHLSDKLHQSFNQSLEQRHMECGDVELF